MIRRFAAGIALLLVLFAGGCSSSGPVETQEQFGVRMAKMNLWREAMFRFRRAVEMSPNDAMAHNNLAVALEANGDFEAAGKAYREAMRLDKSNQFIQKNYSRFVEFTTRDRRRQQRKVPAATPAEDAAKAPDESPAPVTPPVGEPGKPPTPAEASEPDHGDPAPTSAAPVVTPAPNPAPVPVPPTPEPPPPPGGSL